MEVENVDKGEASTILVTGSNGKLGKELIKSLIKKGDTVRALIKRKEMVVELPAGIIPFIGDLTDIHALKKAVEGTDTVFHLAAIVSEYKATTEEIIRVNVDGTRNIMDAAEESGGPHVIFASTVDVYGHKRKDLLTEESAIDPKDRYAYSKVLAEQVINRYKPVVPFTIFRMANIYGPGFEAPFFKVFRLIKEGKARIIGKGDNKLNLVHIYDVLQAMLLAKENKVSRGKVYNLTDGQAHTQEFLFDFIADKLKVPRPSKHVSELLVRFLAKQYGIDSDELRFLMSSRLIDISKIRNELGYSPLIDIEKGGSSMIEDFLKSGGKGV
ncbi:MAG: NAD-dependent epimerase/dehydratase family protein [Candidatus Micrarchaeia archaeon]